MYITLDGAVEKIHCRGEHYFMQVSHSDFRRRPDIDNSPVSTIVIPRETYLYLKEEKEKIREKNKQPRETPTPTYLSIKLRVTLKRAEVPPF